MAQNINVVVLSGRLGKDAEVKFTSSGKAVIKFSIAVNNRVKEGDEWKDKAMWVDIVRFGGEGLAQYLTKGAEVVVEGRLEMRDFQRDDGSKAKFTSVVANTISLCGGGKRGGDADAGDEDVPFS